jgi:aminoglycoside phosphotransferase (APT) family kinase protein
MRRQVSGWIERYSRAKTEDVPGTDALIAWMSERVPDSPSPTVIHNDYKLNNVLLDTSNPRIVSAVLDWEMATIGDPLSDIASLLVYWTEPGEADLMGGLKSVTAEPGFPSRREVLDMYARLSGRDVSALDWYLAFAYFKVGVIVQQIYYRWFKGQTHDARFAELGAVARHLIGKAQAIAGTGSSHDR